MINPTIFSHNHSGVLARSIEFRSNFMLSKNGWNTLCYKYLKSGFDFNINSVPLFVINDESWNESPVKLILSDKSIYNDKLDCCVKLNAFDSIVVIRLPVKWNASISVKINGK